MEVSEQKVRVSDRSGSVFRCFQLGRQDRLDVVLSNNRQRRAALLKGSREYDLVRNGRIVSVLHCGPNLLPNGPTLSVCTSKVLFFDDEARRAAFAKHLHQGSADIRVKEMTEEELLEEALTREQRDQTVETFIRHAFSKVSDTS